MRNNSRIEPSYKKFEIDASWCNLRIGMRVDPCTAVGRDYDTAEFIKAGVYGQVASINFNTDHHTLIILIAVDKA